ncbi:MAG: serine/threonine transporter SstT [Clostridium sp.]|nr:serine/threonine transporter SstT [Clostridium sp.]MCM1459559.1 serine/threonine transporter SstT [Bacteroides sp.]
MKKIVDIYNKTSLILRIFIGLVIGALLGVFAPKATAISILGDIFVGALKAVAPILVFVLVISSLAKASSGIGKKFRTVIILYMLSTFLAAVVAVLASFAFPVTLKLTAAVEQTAPSGISEVLRSLLNNIVANPVSALMNANYIGILAWAVIFGLALKKYGADTTIRAMQDISDAVSQAVKWIINLAPFGILGLVFTTVSTNGLSIFTDYGKLLLLLVGCMLAVALIVDPLIAWICLHQNPYPLVLRCFKESGLTAFFTRSSAANIPINMALCERLGLDKDVYSVSIPLGATINMDGAAITITVMTMAAANTMNIATDIPTAIILSLLSAIAACGASGVAGGSLLLIPMACSLFGISADVAMQVVGVGFIVGVVQDSFETAINSSGDVLFAATAEFRQWKKEGREVRF